MDGTITSSGLRLLNLRRVLDAVYHSQGVSKQGISQQLSLSLPTVSQNLKELEALGLVTRQGLFDSTGGRKAQVYHFCATARFSIGVLLLKEGYHIVATNLYGITVKTATIPVSLSMDETYLRQFGTHINQFVQELTEQPEQILGVAIAVQGLVSPDGSRVFYGEVANCTGLTCDMIQTYINYPCYLIHDAEAAAIGELWMQKDLKNAILFSLSRNFNGLMVVDGEIFHGQTLNGTIEHMRLYPGGRPCYCGKRGCIEAYCSSDALLREVGEPLQAFFRSLRAGSSARAAMWDQYLRNLAIAMNNVRMLVDLEFVLCGYLLQFMNDEDFQHLALYAKEECAFDLPEINIRQSAFSENGAACGAAISLVKQYLDSGVSVQLT